MASRTETLAARRAALAAASVAASAELRRERQDERARARTVAREWVLPEHVQRVALIIYDMAQGIAEPAVKYLAGVGRQSGWPIRFGAALQRMVEDLLIDATSTDAKLEHYAAPTDTSCPADFAAMRLTARRVADWQVAAWSRGQIAVQGLAVSTDQMLVRVESERERLPDAVRPPQRGSSLEGGARKWAHRLRLQHQGRSSKLRVREVLPLAEMRDKALATSRPDPVRLHSTLACFLRPTRDPCHRGVPARAPLDVWAS